MIKTIVMAALCLFLSKSAVRAQALKIGDRVPDITINNVINYKSDRLQLSDFKGKILILDFWATWCSPCLAMIPKMDSLQKAFDGKIQFLQVTYQTAKEVEPFMAKFGQQTRRTHQLPGVMNDKTLHALFPNRSLPHYVWIDENGIVKAITGFREINAGTINAMLQDREANLKEKADVFIPFNKNIPLLVNNNGGDGKNLVYHSLLTSYTDGLHGASHTPLPDSTGAKITITNLALPKIYMIAFREGVRYLGANRLILEVKDSSRLVSDHTGRPYSEWRKDNGYCYELIVPPSLADNIYKIMQKDLQLLFSDYHAALEKRLVKCLALVRTSTTDKLKTAGGPPEASFSWVGCKLTNFSLGRFTAQLNTVFLQKSALPIVNATDYTGRVDLVIDAPLTDVASINRELEKYDLKFVEKMMETEMLVIRDKVRANITTGKASPAN